MKYSLTFIAASVLLTCGPSFAKEPTEFPSRSIRPLVSQVEAQRTFGHMPPQRATTPPPQQASIANPRTCVRAFNARDERPLEDRTCQRQPNIAAQSEFPQLRAFSQASSQRFAP